MVSEGCGEDAPSSKVMQKNAQARCIVLENLYNAYLDKVGDVKSSKDIWGKLKVLFGGDSNKNGEDEKKSKKKKNKKDHQMHEPLQNKIRPPSSNGVVGISKNEASTKPIVFLCSRSKDIATNELFLIYVSDRSNVSLVDSKNHDNECDQLIFF